MKLCSAGEVAETAAASAGTIQSHSPYTIKKMPQKQRLLVGTKSISNNIQVSVVQRIKMTIVNVVICVKQYDINWLRANSSGSNKPT